MKALTESQAITLKVLADYEKQWGHKPTAVELAGYETAEAVSSPDCLTPKAAAQALSFLHRRGLVLRWKTKFGFVYSARTATA